MLLTAHVWPSPNFMVSGAFGGVSGKILSLDVW